MPKIDGDWVRRWGPEVLLAFLAGSVFLSGLGSMDLWGKREQRAVAESIDTVDHGHWLVAEIQNRPRLEKPPLPRWATALLIRATGRRDEAIVRLPSVLSALGIVALVYAMGCRIGGRAVGLSAAVSLCTTIFFVVEMRQAGNDGPLAFFTTLAFYAAWRRLHGGSAEEPPVAPADRLGSSGWTILLHVALGLGFLTKGPIAVLLVVVAIGPYLLVSKRLKAGGRALWSAPGLLLFMILALSWPVPVLLDDPNALRVWMVEILQKAGSAGIPHHHHRDLLLVDWPGATAPWSFVAGLALLLPLTPRGRDLRPIIGLPWWWALGNLAMFCTWSVAKPNYYLPCVPGVALLNGIGWVWICRMARSRTVGWRLASNYLKTHWVVLVVVAAVLPVVVGQRWPALLVPTSWIAAALVLSVPLSVWAWRRGFDFAALAPLAGGFAVLVVVSYTAIVPRFNDLNSHRALAATLDRLLPPRQRTILFYKELDEGLWYYLRDRTLKPVPGTQPRYNKGLEVLDDLRENRLLMDTATRIRVEARELADRLRHPDRNTPYVLIKAKVYDAFAPDLDGLATPVYREADLERNALVLLRLEQVRKDMASSKSGPVDPPARR